MSRYLRRIESNTVLLVSNIKNYSNIDEDEMTLSKELIENKILFEHMV